MGTFQWLYSKATKPLVMILFLFVLVSSYFKLDLDLAQWFMSLNVPYYWPNLSWINFFGESLPYLILFFILALYFQYRQKLIWANRFWFLWFSVFIPISICTVLKINLGRARPVEWFQEQVYGFYGFSLEHNFWSFPSGHTSVLMGLSFGLAIVFPKRGWLWIMLGFLIASTRIILLHHYLSDVLAASYFALLELGVFLYLLRKKAWFKSIYA